MAKILILNTCDNCPDRSKYNDTCLNSEAFNCKLEHSYPTPIPDWCPLKDAPEWKDKPDSEGWWWISDNNIIGCFNMLCSTEHEYYFYYIGKRVFCSEHNYKYLKAIVPEMESK
jgi:hypothetical protein